MAIVFDEVSYTYHQSAPYPALNKFSVSIELGSFVGLIGHTGSGKSTLLEHINGLKLPQSGRVLINGLDTSDKKQRRKIRSLVGFITQNPEHQLFAETVFEDIAFGPRNIGVDEENIKTRVHEALKKTGIEPSEELLAKSPFELSGGEQRRVAIAGILAMKPQILAMDEPFAGLDPAGRRRIMKLTKELNDEGTTIVMISHAMDEIAEVADSILLMSRGEGIAFGSNSEIFSQQELLEKHGLALPEASKYYFELQKRGVDLGDFIYTKDALVKAIRAYKDKKDKNHGV